MAEPQEDELGGSRLAGFSGAFATCSVLLASASSSLLLVSASSSLLASTSGVLVEKLLAAGILLLASASSSLLLASASSSLLLASASSSLLAGMSGLRVEELLAAGILLLAGASGLLNEECLVLVLPQIVDGRLPIPVGTFRASASPKKNGPPRLRRRQQSSSLLVFADGLLKPSFDTKRSTNVGGGVVAAVVFDQPLRGAWGRLLPFKLQPPGRIREGGRGQMGRR